MGTRIPWVKTPPDVIELLDTHLLQHGMDCLNRRVLRSRHFALHYRLIAALQRPVSPLLPGLSARLGLVIPKKNARDAVLRNAVKRQVREVFRRQRPQMPPCDLVFRLAQPIDRPDYRLDKASKALWRLEIEGLFDKLQQTVAGKAT